MRPSPGQVTGVGSSRASGEFFIPDLCAPGPVFAMVLLVELVVLVYTLASSSLPGFNWDLLAICSLFVQWVVLLSAALLCQLRAPFRHVRLWVATVSCLWLVLAVTAFSSFAAWRLFPSLGGGADELWWLLRNLLVAAVLTGIMLRYFYLQQQLRLQEQLELQARLDSLRARIRPHFLFNTLNSIASLIVSRPEEAERAVEDLSELFRNSLQESRQATTVADELHLCELYLGIEQLRLGDRLQVQWQVDAGLDTAPMPSLLLQPLVENAVYHGISQLQGGGTVRVTVRRDAELIRATVENPLPQAPARSGGHHMALANIEQRLSALYGVGASLQTSQGDGSYRVELRYPPEGTA
jgi:two-component system, LytTR family, sensor histidine kinase AlgZ